MIAFDELMYIHTCLCYIFIVYVVKVHVVLLSWGLGQLIGVVHQTGHVLKLQYTDEQEGAAL